MWKKWSIDSYLMYYVHNMFYYKSQFMIWQSTDTTGYSCSHNN